MSAESRRARLAARAMRSRIRSRLSAALLIGPRYRNGHAPPPDHALPVADCRRSERYRGSIPAAARQRNSSLTTTLRSRDATTSAIGAASGADDRERAKRDCRARAQRARAPGRAARPNAPDPSFAARSDLQPSRPEADPAHAGRGARAARRTQIARAWRNGRAQICADQALGVSGLGRNLGVQNLNAVPI